MHGHLHKLEQSHEEILAGRQSGLNVQYVHELCSQPGTRLQMYKLASLPIIVNAGVLQLQMKQMAIFMEQVYLVYFGNYSGAPHMQAILNRLRPTEMPIVQGIGANRQFPSFEPMLTGGVDIISSTVLYSLVRSYFKVHGVTELKECTYSDLFSQYRERGIGVYTHGPSEKRFRKAVRRLWRREYRARGLAWSTHFEFTLKRYWPVLYSIKMALIPFLQGPVDGIYQKTQCRLDWNQIVQSAKVNLSAVEPHIFTVASCGQWWSRIRWKYGTLVFHEKIWDNITGRPQIRSLRMYERGLIGLSSTNT
jgi:hypothetical protein